MNGSCWVLRSHPDDGDHEVLGVYPSFGRAIEMLLESLRGGWHIPQLTPVRRQEPGDQKYHAFTVANGTHELFLSLTCVDCDATVKDGRLYDPFDWYMERKRKEAAAS
jgi:hypothetical protein